MYKNSDFNLSLNLPSDIQITMLLSVKDINDDMEDVKDFNGCYILEDLEKIKLKDGYYIVLILNRNVGNVGHYVSFSMKDGEIWYFDSYGMEAPIELQRIWEKHGIDKYHYGNIDIQSTSNDSTDCGYFAMYIVRGLSNGYSPEEIYESLYNEKNKLDKNDKIVEDEEKYQEKLEGCIMAVKGKKNPKLNPWAICRASVKKEGGVSVVKHVKKLIEPVKRVINFIKGVRIGFSPQIIQFLEANGKANIVAISVERNPISSVIHKALNILSLGKFEENRIKLGYDNVFHLYMTITLDNGVRFVAEKNQVIQFKHPNTSEERNGEKMEVEMPGPIMLDEFFENGIKLVGDNAFFRYSGDEYNCQHWISTLLRANGLMTPELDAFINQDAKSLFQDYEYLKPISRGITDIAARLDRLFSGGNANQKGGTRLDDAIRASAPPPFIGTWNDIHGNGVGRWSNENYMYGNGIEYGSGGNPFSMLVNNAGILPKLFASWGTTSAPINTNSEAYKRLVAERMANQAQSSNQSGGFLPKTLLDLGLIPKPQNSQPQTTSYSSTFHGTPQEAIEYNKNYNIYDDYAKYYQEHPNAEPNYSDNFKFGKGFY